MIRSAGLVAGTVFAFLPYRMVHFVVGHLSLAGTQWFPFYFWGLFDLLKQEKFSWKPVLMAGIAAGLIGLTSPYYVYMTMLISVRLPAGFHPFQRLQTSEVCSLLEKPAGLWPAGGAAGGAFDAAVSQPELPEWPGISRSVEYLNRYSASPTDFVIPSIKQFLWGKWIDNTFSPEIFQESTLYIGAVAFVLAVIAWIKRRQLRHPELLGYRHPGGSRRVRACPGDPVALAGKDRRLPARFLQPIFHRTNMPTIYLPAYYLFHYLPFFSKMRVMMRFGLFTLIFTEPDGRPGSLPVDEIGLLQSQKSGWGLACWCWCSSTSIPAF